MALQIIAHRQNKVAELGRLAAGVGAEIDLRSQGSEIILHHDAFQPGDSFERFVEAWAAEDAPARGTLILNPKEDGLERAAMDILGRHGVSDFFFLDLTIPTTVRWAVREKMSKIAVRVSEYEPIEGALRLAGKVDWAWLDSFSGAPAMDDVARELSQRFRVCLVSPELQGFPPDRIADFLRLAPHLQAVCTKHPDRWASARG